MPHFIIDCSENILALHDEASLIQKVHLTAHSMGLFDEGDIKVRENPFSTYLVGHRREGFIHVFTHIMQGRTTEQK